METYTRKFGCCLWSTRHHSRPFFQHKDQVYVWWCMYMSLQVHTKSQILDAQRSQATSNLPAPRFAPSQRCTEGALGKGVRGRQREKRQETLREVSRFGWNRGLGMAWAFEILAGSVLARMASLQCTHSVIDFWKMLANSGVSKEITLSLQVSSHTTILQVTWLTTFVFGW